MEEPHDIITRLTSPLLVEQINSFAQTGRIKEKTYAANSSKSAFASFKSSVSKPSVNQP
jgi:hypothetical protein